jgi:hypothetical protein
VNATARASSGRSVRRSQSRCREDAADAADAADLADATDLVDAADAGMGGLSLMSAS